MNSEMGLTFEDTVESPVMRCLKGYDGWWLVILALSLLALHTVAVSATRRGMDAWMSRPEIYERGTGEVGNEKVRRSDRRFRDGLGDCQ